MPKYTKKPGIDRFRKALEKYGGRLTAVAKALNVSSQTIYNWQKEDPEFKAAIEASRFVDFTELYDTAKSLAMGIPKLDSDGKRIGWKERPDTGMLGKLLSSLGYKEGFGEHVDHTTNGKDIGGPDLFRVLTPEEIRDFDEHFEEEY